MNFTKHIGLLLPIALMFGACSENATKNEPELSANGKALKGVTASMFDLPSSISDDAPAVAVEGQKSALAKSGVAVSNTTEEASLGFYKVVPVYTHFAMAIKDSVRALIEKLAVEDLPESYNGPWGDYQVTLVSKDSTGPTDEGKVFFLTLKKEDKTVLHLQYRKNSRDQYRGACYFKSEGLDSTAVLLRFNTFNEGTLGKRMTLWITRPESQLEKVGDPSVFRFRAVSTPNGRVVVSGASYHPTFDGDDFWLEGSKVYGFRAISNADKNQAVLRVAFADADSVDEDFFTKRALDKSVVDRATVIWKKAMVENDTIARAVLYSLEKKVTLKEILASPAHILAVWAFKSDRNIEDFTSADMEAYMDLNGADIMAGNDEGMKILYFHVKVKQPIFLKADATIVGYDNTMPATFEMTGADLDQADLQAESAQDLESSEITEEEVANDATDL